MVDVFLSYIKGVFLSYIKLSYIKMSMQRYAMKNVKSKESKQNSSCCSNHHGGRHLFMGLVLFTIGAAFKYGYSSSDVLMLVGALFIAKGIYTYAMAMKKSCNC